MKNHYKVKFNNGGVIHYGIVNSYSDKALKLASENKLFVEDAIYCKDWIVLEKNVVDIDHNEYEKYVNEHFEIDKQTSAALPEGSLIGKLIRFTVADGTSWYKVIRVGKKKVSLEWRGYGLDQYVEPVLGYRGSMDRERCEAYIKSAEWWDKFSTESQVDNEK